MFDNLISVSTAACFVSDTELRPWMVVDLLEETPISTIVILSRDNEGMYRDFYSHCWSCLHSLTIPLSILCSSVLSHEDLL